jgi:hypothetical protein
MTNNVVAFWSCIVCSNVWSADGDIPKAAIWLAIALYIGWRELRVRREEHG